MLDNFQRPTFKGGSFESCKAKRKRKEKRPEERPLCRKRASDMRPFLRRFQPEHSVIIHAGQEMSGVGRRSADTDNNGQTDDEAAEETEEGKLEKKKNTH